jgi:hypothetical protein
MTYKDILDKNPQYLDWDLVIHDKPYQVVKYNGWNNEDYACYKIDDSCERVNHYFIPKDENLELMNCYGVRGEAPTWEIKQTKGKYMKTKWGDTSVRFHCNTVIHRNGIPFFQFGGSEDYAYHKAKAYLVEVLDGPVNFHSRFWRDELIGKKINYNGEPAIIERVNTNMFSMWIVPVNGKFKPPHRWDTDDKDACLNREHWDEEYADGLIVESVLSPEIDWYPKEK